MSELYQSLSHSKWDCKYHVVFVPKRRRKIIFGQTQRQLGTIFHSLARQNECQILERHLMPDHVRSGVPVPGAKAIRRMAFEDIKKLLIEKYGTPKSDDDRLLSGFERRRSLWIYPSSPVVFD